MIEKVTEYSRSGFRCIEKLLDDDPVAINHIVLPYLEVIPEHDSNSNVYLIIIAGTMSVLFEEQPIHEYHAGSILTIPYKTHMRISNLARDTMLEFFIIKAPSPRLMEEH